MPKRRRRIIVVLDTNIFVGNFLTNSPRSLNRRVIRLWFVERKFKLALSSEIQEEYFRIFSDVLKFDNERVRRWKARFDDKTITESVHLGTRHDFSRDPKDNKFLAAAAAARAKFLITRDRDLLDISEEHKRKLKFKIVTPKQFLDYWETLS